MTVRFAPNTRLPFNIIKGSPEQRMKLAEGYTNQITQKLETRFIEFENQGLYGNSISAEELKQIIDSVLPAKIEYSLKDRCCNTPICQLSNKLSRKNGKLQYIINQPQIRVPSISTEWYEAIVHEISHFMNAITQPSTVIKSLINVPKFDATLNFYDKALYVQEPLTKIKKNEIKDFLKQFSTEETINALKFFRTLLQGERNAYSSSYKATEALKTKLQPVIPTNPKEFYFDEKIKYLEKLLRKELRAEKKNIRKISGWKKLFNQIFFSDSSQQIKKA